MQGHRFGSDVRTLCELIAASPIVVADMWDLAPQDFAPRDFADWCRRQPADLDTVVLDWLRSERQAAARA